MDAITRRSSYTPRARAVMANYRRKGHVGAKRSIIRILAIQSIICIIIAMSYIGVKYLNLPLAEKISDNVKHILSYSIDVESSIKSIQQAFYYYFPSMQVDNMEGEVTNEAV